METYHCFLSLFIKPTSSLFCWVSKWQCNEFLQDWGAIVFLDTAPESGVWKFILLVIGSVHVVPAHTIPVYSFIKASLFLTNGSCTHLQYSFPVGVFCGCVCSLNFTWICQFLWILILKWILNRYFFLRKDFIIYQEPNASPSHVTENGFSDKVKKNNYGYCERLN